MTALQYARWKNFSLRMARRGIPGIPNKSRRFVTSCVKGFFRYLDSDIFTINEVLPVKWNDEWQCDDNGILHAYEFLRDRIVNWDHTDSHPTWHDENNHGTNGPYICDIVSQQEEHWNPFYWHEDRRCRQWQEKWGSRISAAIRAGCDMAVGDSTGVMGYTAGDLRRMYRGNVPAWVMGDEPLVRHTFTGVVQGVGYTMGEPEVNGTFQSLPDDAVLWL